MTDYERAHIEMFRAGHEGRRITEGRLAELFAEVRKATIEDMAKVVRATVEEQENHCQKCSMSTQLAAVRFRLRETFDRLLKAGSKGESSTAPVAEKPAKELTEGSAETGGEKAAPSFSADEQRKIVQVQACMDSVGEKWVHPERYSEYERGMGLLFAWEWDTAGSMRDCEFAEVIAAAVQRASTFPRSSQNQAVSGGVEGAHEGTTADKSESVQPAKLNNAHFEQVLESKAHQATCKHENAQLVCLSCGLGIQQGSEALAASPELLPTQLDPISKHSLTPEPQSTQLDADSEKK